MLSFIDSIITSLKTLSENYYILSFIVFWFLPIIEALLPFLPLIVIATAMVEVFGITIGFIMLITSTIIGSFLVYILVRYLFSDKFDKKIANSKFSSLPDYINNVNELTLIFILIFPFTPSFLINYSFALSKMPIKKYLRIIIISKIILCAELVYLGTSFLSIKENPLNFIISLFVFIFLYIGSKLITHKIEK